MASLQDQLLKAGLANQKQAKQATKAKNKQARDQRKGVDTGESAAERATREKQVQAERSKQLNAQRDAAQHDRALLAQVKQMVAGCRVDISMGEQAYNFVDGKAIKKLYVTAQQQESLSRGHLVIVGINGDYSLVPAKVAERIAERTDQVLVVKAEAEQQSGEEDDPYANYIIPDDLMW
ncbi:MAG: DUF2058 domain-containing protein [Gammaproteobacteria bacterium]|jgi:hypothetical protein|nr:DUF2058 domain-containing protein [Gammaproteobacteria bacterium]